MEHFSGIFQICFLESLALVVFAGSYRWIRRTQSILGQFPSSALSTWQGTIPFALHQVLFRRVTGLGVGTGESTRPPSGTVSRAVAILEGLSQPGVRFPGLTIRPSHQEISTAVHIPTGFDTAVRTPRETDIVCMSRDFDATVHNPERLTTLHTPVHPISVYPIQ